MPLTVTFSVSLPEPMVMPVWLPTPPVPVVEAAAEAWETTTEWEPMVSPVPAARLASPNSPPPWAKRKEGLVSTTSAVEETVPDETSEFAAARDKTLNDTDPDGVPDAAVAATALLSEEVALTAPQPAPLERACAAV